MSCETSSVWIKIAIFVLGLVCAIHIVGFATTSWASKDVMYSSSHDTYTVTMTFSSGLWQHCYRSEMVSTELTGEYCACFVKRERSTYPGWFIAVQVLEAIGLAGLVICEIITFFSIISQPNQNMKIPILIILPGSGVSIAIGVIIFGIKKEIVFDFFRELMGSSDEYIGISGQISYSFILCAIAAGLCLFVCLPLFILDMRSKPTTGSQTTVQYSAQGHIIQPHPSDAPMSNQYPTPGNMQGQSNMAYQHPL